MRVVTLTLASSLLATRALAQGGVCPWPHYRWGAKIDTSLAALAPEPASISDMLQTWEPAPLTPMDPCAERSGQERQVYSLVGWVRRIEKHKRDGDWHIELTDRRDSPADSCIVAEIPLAGLSVRYARARADLDVLLGKRTIAKDGDLVEPLQVRITGAAFFDGQHRRQTRRRDAIDGRHGRCNSSLHALWEIHPVYRVQRP